MEGANKKKLLFVKNKNKIVEIGVWLLDTEYKKKTDTLIHKYITSHITSMSHLNDINLCSNGK